MVGGSFGVLLTVSSESLDDMCVSAHTGTHTRVHTQAPEICNPHNRSYVIAAFVDRKWSHERIFRQFDLINASPHPWSFWLFSLWAQGRGGRMEFCLHVGSSRAGKEGGEELNGNPSRDPFLQIPWAASPASSEAVGWRMWRWPPACIRQRRCPRTGCGHVFLTASLCYLS